MRLCDHPAGPSPPKKHNEALRPPSRTKFANCADDYDSILARFAIFYGRLRNNEALSSPKRTLSELVLTNVGQVLLRNNVANLADDYDSILAR